MRKQDVATCLKSIHELTKSYFKNIYLNTNIKHFFTFLIHHNLFFTTFSNHLEIKLLRDKKARATYFATFLNQMEKEGSGYLLHTKVKTIFVILDYCTMHLMGKTANRWRHNLHTKYLPIAKACLDKIIKERGKINDISVR